MLWPMLRGDSPDQIFSKVGSCCLSGAIALCYPNDTNEVLERVEHELGRNVNDWNDDPARTFSDVRAIAEILDI